MSVLWFTTSDYPLVSSNFWPLHCLSFDLRLLITLLLSSNFWPCYWLSFDWQLLNTTLDQDEMSNPYRGPPIDASYQVSVHLAKRFQRRRFSLEINQSETRIICGGHVCKWIWTKWAILIEDLLYILPTKFQFIWPCSFRGNDFQQEMCASQNTPVYINYQTV